MTYTEKQYYLSPRLRWLQLGCFSLSILQIITFAAAETGMVKLPFSHLVHLVTLMFLALTGGLLWSAGLILRISASGIAIRFFPYRLHFQEVHWHEIRRVRLLTGGELPADMYYGSPMRDFTHFYWLTRPALRVLCIELINNTQLYISTEQPQALLDFLQHGVLAMGKYGIKT